MTDENFTINIYTANTKKTKIYSRKISDIISLGEQIEALINLSILEAHNIFKEDFMKSYYIKFVVDKETKIFILYKKNGLRENDTVLAFGQLLTENEVEVLNKNELAVATYGEMPEGPCLRIEFLLQNLLAEQTKFGEGYFEKQMDKLITASTIYYMYKVFFAKNSPEDQNKYSTDIHFTLYNNMTHTAELERFSELYSVVIGDIENSLSNSEIDLFQLFPNEEFDNIFIKIKNSHENKDSFQIIKRKYESGDEVIVTGDMYHTEEELLKSYISTYEESFTMKNIPCLILNGINPEKIISHVSYYILCSYLTTILGFYFILNRENRNLTKIN